MTVCYSSECFLPKVSGLRSTHTDDENFQHNCKLLKSKNEMLLQSYRFQGDVFSAQKQQ